MYVQRLEGELEFEHVLTNLVPSTQYQVVPHCTVYCTVLYCTVLYCTVLYCTLYIAQVSLQTIFHRPFSLLSEESVEARRLEIRSLAGRGRYKEAVRRGYTFIDTVMEGVEYYQRYQQSV